MFSGTNQRYVGMTGSVGAVLISKVIFMENKKNNATQLMNIVLLDEVEVDVMPHEKFIVYHMKAYMDRAYPRKIFFSFDGGSKVSSRARRGFLSLHVVLQMLS